MNAITDFPPIEEPGALAVPIVSIKSAVLAQFADAEKTVTALADKYKRVAYDCATPKGMADAKAARLDLRENGRYAVQRAEAKVKTEVNDLKRIMAGEVERLVGIVRPVEDAIDGQIKAREEQLAAEKAERERHAAEAARIEAERRQRLEDGITTLAGYVGKANGKTAAQMAAGIAFVEKITVEPAHWQEYTECASATLSETLVTLREMHAAQVKAEADAAELEALRREKAEREAEDALVATMHENSRRIEGMAVAYVQKAIAYFESGAKDWQDDYRPRVREAVSEGRRYLAEMLAEAMAREEARAAEELAAARVESERLEALAIQQRDARERAAAASKEYTEGPDAPQVLKAEAETPDATDRATPADASLSGGSMGAGQPAAAGPAGGPITTLKLCAIISDRLGFTLTRTFVESLGINPVGTEKAAVLFAESDWPRLCDALVAHIQAKRGVA